jgi:hypothetical protein
MFSLKIETDNDAFHDNPKREIARILKSLTDVLDNDDESFQLNGQLLGYQTLFDYNGNTVGSAELSIHNSRPQPQGRYHR